VKPRQRDPFSALADPTRRAVLRILLEEGVLPAGQIAARFQSMSRAAVSKHLRMLREARLVHAEEIGREWHYRLDPEPMVEIYQDWIAPFVAGWELGLEELKRRVEESPGGRERGSVPTFDGR
jgi:DNA-binding transcriptional ArsR family regulator